MRIEQNGNELDSKKAKGEKGDKGDKGKRGIREKRKKGKWEKDVGYLTRWAKGPANRRITP